MFEGKCPRPERRTHLTAPVRSRLTTSSTDACQEWPRWRDEAGIGTMRDRVAKRFIGSLDVAVGLSVTVG